MHFTSILILLASSTALACDSQLWGQGTCNYPVKTQSGNGSPITPDIAAKLEDCFKSKYGDGPYEFDGNVLPDSGGLGKAYGVQMNIDGTDFQASVGNLCGCTQSMDGNAFNDLKSTAAEGEYLTIVLNCASDTDSCPAVTGSDGTTLPAGVYANMYSCPPDYCNGNGYEKYETC